MVGFRVNPFPLIINPDPLIRKVVFIHRVRLLKGGTDDQSQTVGLFPFTPPLEDDLDHGNIMRPVVAPANDNARCEHGRVF